MYCTQYLVSVVRYEQIVQSVSWLIVWVLVSASSEDALQAERLFSTGF